MLSGRQHASPLQTIEACGTRDEQDGGPRSVSITRLAPELDTTEYVVRRLIQLGELTAYRMSCVIRVRREGTDTTRR